jgi:2-oxoglutarate dehydrogenase E2 component (dihydrolipoamide succinyltransferase)
MPQQVTGTAVRLPSLGEGVTEATITRWLKAPGDRVEAEEALLEVATDKVDTEIPSPVAGLVREIVAAEGELVAIEAVLATIDSGDQPDEACPVPVTVQPAPAPASVIDTAPARAPVVETVPRVEDSPPTISPSPGPAATGQSGSRVERLPRIRQIIAGRMLTSLHTTAQLTSVVEADITGIAALRSAQKDEFLSRTGVKLSFLPFFVKATLEALGEHPLLNSTVNADCTEITYHETVNLGIAVDGPKGLMVPVIRDAQHMTVSRLATAISTAADKIRTGQITPDDLAGGTFTITNTGSRGALFDTPILNSPESAILGTGAVVERVIPDRDSNGTLTFGVRSIVYLALTYDHRTIDGADAARFLGGIKNRLHCGFTADELR